MTKSELEKERYSLFDENFNQISDDVERIKTFCYFLREVSGVQVCNIHGGICEYIAPVYQSVLNTLN